MEEKQVIERIKSLCAARQWSAYRLAKESGLTYSTLCTMLNKSNTPSIPTLMKICDGFGITLSEFFDDGRETVVLTDEERQLREKWRRLSREDQAAVQKFIDFLLETAGNPPRPDSVR